MTRSQLFLDRLNLGNRNFQRLEGVLGKSGIEFANLGRLSDEARIRSLGIFRLDLNGAVQGLGGQELLEESRTVFERLLRVLGRLRSNGLEVLRKSRSRRGRRLELFFSEFLKIFEIVSHVTFPKTRCAGSP